MAAEQEKRHAPGRAGERAARKLVGGKLTPHTAPFDMEKVV